MPYCIYLDKIQECKNCQYYDESANEQVGELACSLEVREMQENDKIASGYYD